MLNEIKKELLANPQYIVDILETYEFFKVHIQNNEVRFGLAEGHNPTAIRIKLANNNNLFVTDYVRGLNYDLITYIIKVRGVQFTDVINAVKAVLGVSDFYDFNTRKQVFGGFYDKIKNKSSDLYVRTLNKSILTQYQDVYNARFLEDNISFETQDAFQIGYDVESQRITIPIFNAAGELIGVKGRANWELSEEDKKYLYLQNCPMSSTLYGYCQNYQYLVGSDIMIFEAEKSVLQCHSYDIHNCVALGSNSLSPFQCKLLMELNPKRVVFMLDNGLDYEITKRNKDILKPYTRMFDTEIWWWDWSVDTEVAEKASPSDMGKEKLIEIMNTQIRRMSDD